MRPSHLRVLGWTALLLLLLEVGLELRAHLRGHGSILFGAGIVRFESISEEGQETTLMVGPLPEFPFRSPVVPRSKPEGTVRIWFSSASHAEDAAVSVPDVFPNRMGAILRENGTAVEVLNASKAGLGIGDNIGDLKTLGPAWQPDYAILYGLANDMGVLARELLSRGTGTIPVDGRPSPPDGSESVSGPFRNLDRFYSETTVYAQLRAHVTPLVTRQRRLADSLPAAAEEWLRAALNGYVNTAFEIGVSPILTTLATSHSWQGPNPLPLAAEKFILRFNPHLEPSGWLRSIRSMNEVIREVAGDRGVLLIDLEAALANKPGLFRDPVHFTLEGHGEAAVLLADGFTEAFGQRDAGGER